jgi:hypothetical protein
MLEFMSVKLNACIPTQLNSTQLAFNGKLS